MPVKVKMWFLRVVVNLDNFILSIMVTLHIDQPHFCGLIPLFYVIDSPMPAPF